MSGLCPNSFLPVPRCPPVIFLMQFLVVEDFLARCHPPFPTASPEPTFRCQMPLTSKNNLNILRPVKSNYLSKCRDFTFPFVKARVKENKWMVTPMRIIARWEGKSDWIELSEGLFGFIYKGNDAQGFIEDVNSEQEAIQLMERRIKLSGLSMRRTI